MGLNSTPRTWLAGDVVTAAQLNTEIRDALIGIQAPWTTDSRASTAIWSATSTAPALGNGTISSRYRQIGKTVSWTLKITMGSTTTYGSGTWQLALPVAALDFEWLQTSHARDLTGPAPYVIFAEATSTTQVTLRTLPATAGAALASVGAAAPFGWASGDILFIALRYEAA